MATGITPASSRSAEQIRKLSDEEFNLWVAQVKAEGRTEGLTEAVKILDSKATEVAKGGPDSAWRTGRVDGLELAGTLVHHLNLYT